MKPHLLDERIFFDDKILNQKEILVDFDPIIVSVFFSIK